MAKNHGMKLVGTVPETNSNGVQLVKAIKNRPEDIPILSGHQVIQPLTFPNLIAANNNREDSWKFIREILWTRFDWEPDQKIFGQLDHWKSFYNEYLDGSTDLIFGDCEDLALTAIEFAIAWGIQPQNLYLVLCLTTAGQALNRQARTKADRKALDHCVALLEASDGTQWLIDSSEKREIERVEDSRLEFYSWHCMADPILDWPDTNWELCELVDI